MKTALKIVACVFVFTILVLWTGYQTGDPDSQFYVYLVRQMAMRPPAEWMAPYWLGEQGIRADGIVQDHLAGHLGTGLLFWKLGIHPSASLYTASFLWVVSTYLVFYQILKRYLTSHIALTGTLLCILFPISFLYRVRANHEQSLLLLCALSVLVALYVKRSLLAGWFIAVLSVALFLVKGFVFPVIPMIYSLALLFSGEAHFKRWFLSSFSASALSVILVGIVAWFYEMQFKAITGEPFFEVYFKVQLLERSVNLSLGEYPYLLRRLYALGYYSVQTLWYGLPVTLLSLTWLLRRKHDLETHPQSQKTLKSRLQGLFVGETVISFRSQSPLFQAKQPHVQAALMLLSIGISYVLLLSLSDRVSGRYVFPAFYFIPLGLFAAAAPWLQKRLDALNPWFADSLKSWSTRQERAESVILIALLIITSVHILTTNRHSLKQFPKELPFEPIRPEYLEPR